MLDEFKKMNLKPTHEQLNNFKDKKAEYESKLNPDCKMCHMKGTTPTPVDKDGNAVPLAKSVSYKRQKRINQKRLKLSKVSKLKHPDLKSGNIPALPVQASRKFK